MLTSKDMSKIFFFTTFCTNLCLCFFEGFPKRWVLVYDGYIGGDICVGDLGDSGILVVILRLF